MAQSSVTICLQTISALLPDNFTTPVQESLASSMTTSFMGGSSTCISSPGAGGGGERHETCGGTVKRDDLVTTPVAPNKPPVGKGALFGDNKKSELLQSAVSETRFLALCDAGVGAWELFWRHRKNHTYVGTFIGCLYPCRQQPQL